MAVSPYVLTHAFLLTDLPSLLSIVSLYPLLLIQAVYCVCSAEQPALKAVCVCVFVPASLSDHVNPLRGPGHLLPALPPFPLPLLHNYASFSGCRYALPPVSQMAFTYPLANHTTPYGIRQRSGTNGWELTTFSLPVPMVLCIKSMAKMLHKWIGHVSVVLLNGFSVASL